MVLDVAGLSMPILLNRGFKAFPPMAACDAFSIQAGAN